MRKNLYILGLILMLVFVSHNCKQKSAIKGVDLDVTFSEETLTDNLVTDMTFLWATNSEFEGMRRDYNVFVHFWHGDNLLFQASGLQRGRDPESFCRILFSL